MAFITILLYRPVICIKDQPKKKLIKSDICAEYVNTDGDLGHFNRI